MLGHQRWTGRGDGVAEFSLNKYLFIFTMYKFQDDFLAVADSADLPWEVCAQTPDTATAHMEPTFANRGFIDHGALVLGTSNSFHPVCFLRTFEPQDNFGKAFCDSPLMLYISQMDTFEVRKKKRLELGWNYAPEARLNSGHTSGFLPLDLSDSLQKSDRNTGSLLPMPPTSHVGNSYVVPNIAPVQRKLSQCFRRHGKPGGAGTGDSLCAFCPHWFFCLFSLQTYYSSTILHSSH